MISMTMNVTLSCVEKWLSYTKRQLKQPADAKAAFKKEILKVIEKEVWPPVHVEDLTEEECALVIPMMKNFSRGLKTR